MRRISSSNTRDRGRRAGTRAHRRAIAIGTLAAGTLAAMPAAGQADEAQQLEHQAAAAERAATRAAQREQRKAEREERQLARRLAAPRERMPKHPAPKEKRGDLVKVSCSNVVVEYQGLPEMPDNQIDEYVVMVNRKSGIRWVEAPIELKFNGSSVTTTIPIVPPIGESMIRIHARWRPTFTNGMEGGGFDIHGMVISCPPVHAFKMQELQSIQGSGEAPTASPLKAKPGQTIDYETVISNTGNTPLKFGAPVDSHCGPVEGLPAGALAARTSVTLKCSHTLTIADAGAGQYINALSIVGSDEGANVSHESNQVVVSPEVEPGGGDGGGGNGGNGDGEPSGPTSTGDPQSGVLDSSSSSAGAGNPGTAKSGVLSFTPFAVPALHGPQGCLRPSSFRVSVKSRDVQSVVFYLDGHKLRMLTARAARNGSISISIGDLRLRVGVHKVTAKITMKNNGTAKGRVASRRLLVARCASSTVRPRFTG